MATGDEAAMADVAVKERGEWKRPVAKQSRDSRRTWKEKKARAIMEDQRVGAAMSLADWW
jgi:hypothetical protein